MSVLSSPMIMATIALLVTNVAHGLPMNDQPLVRAYSDLDPAPDVPTTDSRSGFGGGSKVSSTTIIVVAVILGVLVTLGVGGMMSMLVRRKRRRTDVAKFSSVGCQTEFGSRRGSGRRDDLPGYELTEPLPVYQASKG